MLFEKYLLVVIIQQAGTEIILTFQHCTIHLLNAVVTGTLVLVQDCLLSIVLMVTTVFLTASAQYL